MKYPYDGKSIRPPKRSGGTISKYQPKGPSLGVGSSDGKYPPKGV
jgi:hypothetical protein